MRKKLSFVILSNTGAPAKQVCISKASIRLFCLAVFVCLALVGYVVYDYYNLKHTTERLQLSEVTISAQMNEIQTQRKQIQEFSNEINNLKEKIVALNQFEKKIRIIANIERTNLTANIFGVGGSIPEDLDAQIPIKEKHNSLMREMHNQIDQLSLASTNQQQGFESLLKELEDQQNLLASTPAIRPVRGWTTSKFGYRISPFTGRREFHKGYDIATKKGAPVLATAAGVVTFVGRKGLLGNAIIIDHGHGMVTTYAHCDKILKKRGDKVKRWEPIATVGSTGRSTGPHVHYQVNFNGIPVNPEKYILN
jgi:murein DD-endopeptidase MepM/ murein hydrolase activator NlpD